MFALHQTHHSSTHSQDKLTSRPSLSNSPPSYAASRSKSQCQRHKDIYFINQQSPIPLKASQLPYQLYPTQYQNLLKSKKEHFQLLTKDNRQRNLQRLQQKSQQQQSLIKCHSFQPNLVNSQLPQHFCFEVFQRLYQQSKIRLQKQNKIQKQKTDKQIKQIQQCQHFNKKGGPDMMINNAKYDLNPLYLRIQKVMKEHIEHKKMIAERQTVYTYQPQINKKSEQIVNKQQRINSIVDRLLQDFKIRENKVNQLRQKLNQQMDKKLTFKPNINNFMPPQIPNKYSIVSQTHSQVYTFKPKINDKSNLMAKQQRQDETQQNQINRLHSAPILKLSQKISFIQQQMYAQCSFNPQINQLSRQIQSTQVKSHHCQTPIKEQPTHRPQINEVSKTMTSKKRARSIDNFKQKTKTKAQRYIKEIQYSQLKQCTFKPKILSFSQSKNSSKSTSVHNISGYNNYIKNIQKSKQQQKSRRILEQKLFNLQKNYDKRMQKKERSKLNYDQSQNALC